MLDTLIRGGSIVDGTGAEARTADVGIENGRIVEVGRITAQARRVIDADGLLVTPGWVDIHTHYDGQSAWDDQLAPSFWHGVTSVVMGNCGVGFAPVHPDRREWLIEIMEVVEDIPKSALQAGIEWDWETFPQFMDALRRRRYAMNVGALIPHGALRSYVMGDRGATNQPSDADDQRALAEAVRGGMAAGALGFSITRSTMHRAPDGSQVPGATASMDELEAIARAIAGFGRGIMQVAPAGLNGDDLPGLEAELAWMMDLSARTGVPISFLCLQIAKRPDFWREQIAQCRAASAQGAKLTPQIYSRAVGAVLTLENKINPFRRSETMRNLDGMPFEERVRLLQSDHALREKIISEGAQGQTRDSERYDALFGDAWKDMYAVTTPIDYEPDPENSISRVAARAGRDPRSVAMDALLADGGRGAILHQMTGYANGNLDPHHDMLSDPTTVLGGGDGGAHVSIICDAGVPTFMLTHWARDRTRGPRLPLELVVKKQTLDTARTFGIPGRGAVQPGFAADINIIDFDNLGFTQPVLLRDMPANAERLMQKAKGYVATMVNGTAIHENGEDTGERPGMILEPA